MIISKTLVKNISANYIGVGGQMLIAFFLAPFLVHTLGDSRYGIWTVISAFSGYMSLLDLGIASALTRYVARHYRRKEFDIINGYINSALALFLVISLVIVSLASVLAGFISNFMSLEPDLQRILEILTIVISFDVSLFVIAGVFRGAFGGFQRFDIINIARLGAALFKALVWYVILTEGYGLLAMAYISILANLLLIAFYLLALRHSYQFTNFNMKFIKKEHILNVFHFSKFIFLAMIAHQLLNYSSPFVIGYFMSAAAITYYSIPWTLAEYTKQLTLAVSRTYIPAFSEIDSENRAEELYQLYLNGTRVMMVVSNLFCAGMLGLGTAFISVWMGARYAVNAEPLIWIMFMSFYFNAPHLISYALLQGIARNKRFAQGSMMTAAISLVLSIMLVQDYGLVGVALGVAVPQVLFSGLLIPWYVSKVIFRRSIIEYWLKTHAMAIVPGGCLYALLVFAQSIWVADSFVVIFLEALACACLYLVLVFSISLRRDEKAGVRAYISRLLN